MKKRPFEQFLAPQYTANEWNQISSDLFTENE
jgi:hypothetical protein